MSNITLFVIIIFMAYKIDRLSKRVKSLENYSDYDVDNVSRFSYHKEIGSTWFSVLMAILIGVIGAAVVMYVLFKIFI